MSFQKEDDGSTATMITPTTAGAVSTTAGDGGAMRSGEFALLLLLLLLSSSLLLLLLFCLFGRFLIVVHCACVREYFGLFKFFFFSLLVCAGTTAEPLAGEDERKGQRGLFGLIPRSQSSMMVASTQLQSYTEPLKGAIAGCLCTTWHDS